VKRVALVGARGHGASYFDRLERMRDRARLVAVADPRPPGPLAPRLGDAAWYPNLADLLASDAKPDVVVIATPTHTHSALAVAALRSGADVLLEKPPAPSLAEFETIQAAVQDTGGLCQIGFQTYGSEAIGAVQRMVADGEIGTVTGYGAVGTWVRTAGYWARSAWAGRRGMDGQDVVDGVVTNPLAHAVATALLLAAAPVADVTVDLYRANDIEADDTSSGVVTLSNGLRLGFGFTLCAPRRSPALVLVHGTRGTLRLAYETDTVQLNGQSTSFGRVDLLEDLLEARETGRHPRCPVSETAAFMQVVDAVRSSDPPMPIGPDHVRWEGEDEDRHPIVTDVEWWCQQAATQGETFSALGAPWAQ
jgi:predicted dehydrogenase